MGGRAKRDTGAGERTCAERVEAEGDDEEVFDADRDLGEDEDVPGSRLGERPCRPDAQCCCKGTTTGQYISIAPVNLEKFGRAYVGAEKRNGHHCDQDAEVPDDECPVYLDRRQDELPLCVRTGGSRREDVR